MRIPTTVLTSNTVMLTTIFLHKVQQCVLANSVYSELCSIDGMFRILEMRVECEMSEKCVEMGVILCNTFQTNGQARGLLVTITGLWAQIRCNLLKYLSANIIKRS